MARFIEEQNEKDAHWFVACYDMKKAFDSISRTLLFKALRTEADKRDCPGEHAIIDIWEELFSVTHIHVGDGIEVRTDKGVPQGAKSSPSLFNFYLHQLVIKSPILTKLAQQDRFFAYADDLCIMSDTVDDIEQATEALK